MANIKKGDKVIVIAGRDDALMPPGIHEEQAAGIRGADLVFACIGPATAKTAQEHGLTVSVIAESASGDALVDALAAHGRSLREQARAAGEELQRPSQTRTTGRRKSR